MEVFGVAIEVPETALGVSVCRQLVWITQVHLRRDRARQFGFFFVTACCVCSAVLVVDVRAALSVLAGLYQTWVLAVDVLTYKE